MTAANNRLLVHVCCAHCAAYTFSHWRKLGYKVTALWYNPNIHPYSEHHSRLEAVRRLTQEMDCSLIEVPNYDLAAYFRSVAGNEHERCRHCFRLRLGKTAGMAREMGMPGFTSTLLISPHQHHNILRVIGSEMAAQAGLDFYYEDLRKRYSDSRCLTKPLVVYRQQYCGCLYSEWERYTQNPSL